MKHLKDWDQPMKDKAQANFVRLAEAWAKGKTPEEQEKFLGEELRRIEVDRNHPHSLPNEPSLSELPQPDAATIDNLIKTLEILRDALWAKNKDGGSEAVTVLLMQFMAAFGGSPEIVGGTFPVLEELKDYIQSEEFDEASPVVLALLVRFRQVREAIEGS